MYKVTFWLENIIVGWAYKIVNKRIERGFNLEYYYEGLLPGILAFCKRKLKDKSFVKFNTRKAKVFKQTVTFIENDNPMTYEYIAQNVWLYWD